MRQVANIPHPEFTVNLYAWNNKYLLKFEHQWLEQTFKLSEMDVTGDADVIAIVNDPDFITAVRDNFARMAQQLGTACAKHL